ncbi:MAG: vWA domain-containing protein [Planctomycetota bacterium]
MNKRIASIAFVVTLALVHAAAGQTLHVVAGPPQADDEDLILILQSVAEVGMHVEHGDEVRVIDALTQAPVASFAMPASASARGKAKHVVKQLAAIRRYYDSARSTLLPYSVHLPNLLDSVYQATVSSDRRFSETRILLIGSALFGDGTDARYDFVAGEYPSAGHVAAARSHSVYGTADARRLRNTRLDWLNLTPIVDDGHRLRIREFWTLYCQQRGVVLTSWSAHANDVLVSFKSGSTEPIEHVIFDSDDLRRQILRVEDASGLANTWSIVFVVDASASMQQVFDQIRSEIPVLAERLYEAGARIRVAVVPFREQPLPVLGWTDIRTEDSDGGRSSRRLGAFLGGVEPMRSTVDPDAALRVGMQLVDSDLRRSTFASIVLVGDTTAEADRDRGRFAQLLADLHAWSEAAEGRSVLGIDVGNGQDPGFARLAGPDRVAPFGSVRELADSIVRQAADVTRGGERR